MLPHSGNSYQKTRTVSTQVSTNSNNKNNSKKIYMGVISGELKVSVMFFAVQTISM
uniref:Uncharacterized protein n=1 Tax=Anguilla anguilla TaxID=7936 RepID=A0A0E9S4I5_ANGAN